MADPAAGVFALVAAGVTFPTLLAAGCHHLLHLGRLVAVLRQRGWTATWARPGGALIALAEVGLGAAGVVGMIIGPPRAIVAMAATALFAAYAIDAAAVLRSGRQVPCGCGAVDHPVNQWVVVRAVAYACLSAVAAAQGSALAVVAPAAVLTVVTSVTVIGLLLWLLPRALAIPPGFSL
jgi:hypothetical protein